MPELAGSILFVEETAAYDITEFRRTLVALLQQPGGHEIRGVVIGRFQPASNVTREQLELTIKAIPQLGSIPVVANVDFGHTNPQLTFPLGGTAELSVGTDTTVRFPR